MAAVDPSFELLAARYIRKHARELKRQLAGAAGDDHVECVHQARVAGRRLRAGFRFFGDCLGAKRTKRWRRAVRRATKSLGPARDRDVQIAFLTDVLANLPNKRHAAGIERVLLRLQQQRKDLQGKVERAARRLRDSGEVTDMIRRTRRRIAKLAERQTPPASAFLFAAARDRILERWEELGQWQESLAVPEDLDGHHRMRIAAKRLRYTLELCRPAYGEELNDPIAAAKQLQQLLGDIHDCDVWVEDLQRFIEAEQRRTVRYHGSARPFARLKTGLAFLRDERAARRRKTFEELVALWRRQENEGVWRRMLATLDAHAPRPPAAGEPPVRIVTAPGAAGA